MLDQNALQQLKQLKTDIIESKDQGEGEVRGSQRRFCASLMRFLPSAVLGPVAGASVAKSQTVMVMCHR